MTPTKYKNRLLFQQPKIINKRKWNMSWSYLVYMLFLIRPRKPPTGMMCHLYLLKKNSSKPVNEWRISWGRPREKYNNKINEPKLNKVRFLKSVPLKIIIDQFSSLAFNLIGKLFVFKFKNDATNTKIMTFVMWHWKNKVSQYVHNLNFKVG